MSGSETHPRPRGRTPGDGTSTSRTLLARIRGDDVAAWERLVTLYAPFVLRWCRRQQLQEDDVADVFQEVFKTVATKIGSFRKLEPGDTFRGWLHTITRNKIYDHYRRVKRQPRAAGGTTIQRTFNELPAPSAPEPPAAPGPSDERALFRSALERIRGQFRPRTWKAFWRTVVDDVAPKDVADELGMTPGAVRVAKSRVLHRLRDELGELPTLPP